MVTWHRGWEAVEVDAGEIARTARGIEDIGCSKAGYLICPSSVNVSTATRVTFLRVEKHCN